MPRLPLHPCSAHGCRELIPHGQRCPVHGKAISPEQLREQRRNCDANRAPANERGYDHAWMECRAAYIAAHPWCEVKVICAGDSITKRIAAEVHHKAPIREAPELRLDWANLQSVCRPCHIYIGRQARIDAETVSEDGRYTKESSLVLSC
jgi:5-methylcytosine-specific restriction protein A